MDKRETVVENDTLRKYNYSTQDIDNSDLKAVQLTLRNANISRGPKVFEFEEKIKSLTKAKYVIGVNSGTSALIAALKSLSLKENSTVIVPNITFVASANSILLCNFNVKLIDVDENTGLLKIDDLKRYVKDKNVSCLINVHLNGNINNLKLISEICKKNKVKIIDDACHALGTTYYSNAKQIIGDNKYCDISTLSFHPTKLITTGEGGAILTNNKKVFSNLKKIINHGYENYKIKKGKYFHDYYRIKKPGYNFRISDLNCSLGLSQLRRFKKKLTHRRKIANFYNKFLTNNNYLDKIEIESNINSAYHLYPILIKNFKKINKYQLMKNLKRKKIFTQIHYLPLNMQPLFKEKNSKFVGSKIYFEKTLSIPIHDKITINDAKYIIKTITLEIIKLDG